MSVTTTARSSSREPRAASTASTSRCGVTTTRARDSRHASTRDACEWASETSSEPGPDRPTTAPRLAVYPEENTKPDAAPTNSASSASNSWCSSVSPVTSREPVAPAPQMRSACNAAVDDVGMLRQAEVVVGRQIQFNGDRGARAQRTTQPGLHGARPPPRPATPAVMSRSVPSSGRPWFQPTSCSASTNAEVIATAM